jgi:anthranilate phosphoribosyltransferase
MTKPHNHTYEEHPFAQYVRILGKGKKGSRSLTEQEACDAMSMILKDQAEELQIGAFLMLLRVKEESPEELSGFVKAVRACCPAPADIAVDLDWSSYAGKRRHLPWYLFSIFLLAKAGHRVFIHGASGHTANRLYTENALEELGVPIADNWDAVRNQLDQQGFSYMPLRHISHHLAEMINMRSILGLRSPVHSLSRLINPLNARAILQGIFHPAYSTMHQQAGACLGYQHLVVIKGEGGEIERNPDNVMNTLSSTLSKEGSQLSEESWPAMFPKRHVKADDMSTDHMKAVWQNQTEDEYASGAVIGTTALALKTLDANLTQEAALEKAAILWKERDYDYL